jgi:hypothetical protein
MDRASSVPALVGQVVNAHKYKIYMLNINYGGWLLGREGPCQIANGCTKSDKDSRLSDLCKQLSLQRNIPQASGELQQQAGFW